MSVKAVIFDLDDTLYPEIDYVRSGFRAVGQELYRRFGLSDGSRILFEYFVQDKADVFGRVLRDKHVCFDQTDIDDLVKIYREHEPDISLTGETIETLSYLRRQGYHLGIITDGRPQQQRAKIKALGLTELVDEIVITDELGGIEYRKPNPAAFTKLCAQFDVLPEETVYIGDNPQKDFAIKQFLPIKTIQLESDGLYHAEKFELGIAPDRRINKLSEIQKIVKEL